MRAGRANGGDWLRLAEAAAALGISPGTLRHWSDSGTIRCYRSPGGHRRYRRRDVEAFLTTASTRQTAGPAHDAGPAEAVWGIPPSASARPGAPGRATTPGDAEAESMDGGPRSTADLVAAFEAALHDTAAHDTEDVLRSVARRLAMLTDTPVVDVYAVEGGALRTVVTCEDGRIDEDWSGRMLPLAHYPNSLLAVETGDIIVAADVDDPVLGEHGRRFLDRFGYACQLSLPLSVGGRVVALVELSDYRPRAFAAERGLIRDLGRAAARAFDNASRFEQAAHRTASLNQLVEISALASMTDDADLLAGEVAEQVLKAVDAATCDIYRTIPTGLTCVASFDRSGHDETAVGRFIRPERYPALTEAAAAGQTFLIPDLDDPRLSEAERRLYREHGLVSEVAVPLLADGRVLGLLDVCDTVARSYVDDLGFLQATSRVLSRSFQHAALLGRLEAKTAALAEMVELGALALDAPDLESVLASLATRLLDVLDVVVCDIYALQGDSIRLLVRARPEGLDADAAGKVLRLDRFPATALAVRTGELVTVADLDDPRLTPEERADILADGYRSELCVPLIAADRVIGVVDVFDSRPRSLDTFSDYLLTAGHTAAAAIGHARLVEDLRDTNRSLLGLLDLQAALGAAGDTAELAGLACPAVARRLGAAGCRLSLLVDGTLRPVPADPTTAPQGLGAGGQERAVALEVLPGAREALAAHQPFVVRDLDDPRLGERGRALLATAGYASVVRVPLVCAGRVLGVLDVLDRHPRSWEGHADYLGRAADIVARALAPMFPHG